MKNVALVLVSTLLSGSCCSIARADIACFEVQGMTCATCPITVKAAVRKLNGINDVKASLERKNAVVDFDPKRTSPKEIQKAIDDVGYKAVSQECKKNKG